MTTTLHQNLDILESAVSQNDITSEHYTKDEFDDVSVHEQLTRYINEQVERGIIDPAKKLKDPDVNDIMNGFCNMYAQTGILDDVPAMSYDEAIEYLQEMSVS